MDINNITLLLIENTSNILQTIVAIVRSEYTILHCPVYSDLTIATIVCSILDVFSIKSKVILLTSNILQTIVAIVRSEYTGQCNIDIYIFSAPSEESVINYKRHGFL
jgi:hypothetical protein